MTASAVSARDHLAAVYDEVVRRSPAQPEFHQAAREVLETLAPVLASARPELGRRPSSSGSASRRRQILFRVPWTGRHRPHPRQPRLPRGVQQCSGPLQGRSALPPVRSTSAS
ncbi:hypothetical protein ACRAWF_36100 [Streptomyces sp. L7]